MGLTEIHPIAACLLITLGILVPGLLLAALMRSVRKRIMGDECPSAVNSSDVTDHFHAKGYMVCDVKPLENNKKWLAFIVKDGEYSITTVFADNDNTIRDYRDVLV